MSNDRDSEPTISSNVEEDCPCRDGMKPHVELSRRGLLMSAVAASASGVMSATAMAADKTKAPPGAALYDVPDDPTKVMGRGVHEDGGYGTRSQFETEVREKEDRPLDATSWTYTPLAATIGNLTPSGLHFERHHGGIPTIDPSRHDLYLHGLVDVAKKFTMADIKSLPSITRRYFIECSGNTLFEWQKPTGKNVQFTHGLLSTSEWTGVPFAALARQVGLKENAAWVLAEGADAAVMTRSIPLDKLMSDALIAYGQNGEALRPEQGYPLRLILPGYEGNTQIKWLRRLQVSNRPFQTHEETAAYTDLMKDGRSKQFTLQMDPKSVITFPSGEMMLPKAGFYLISGIAWTGRGRVNAVDISLDGGKSWAPARLDTVPEPNCTVRFSYPWHWDGKPAVLQSRCIDDAGNVQPTRTDLIKVRGLHSVYHYNAIQSWAVAADGSVSNVHV
ncbi:sulfite dehydrogenase [Hyphomicrobium methylovorum]|uniref:sulfite dehydrogenase n=1 Tax=Hyphomicrobium methylovorum TaxID=84 RepID=UPI0031B58BC8